MSSVGVATRDAVPGPAIARGTTRQLLLLSLVLVATTAALYLRVTGYDFVNYDDTIYVTHNANVQQGLTAATVRWAFTTYRVGTWHPLTWLSHALDWQLFDLDAAGPHAVNLVLHLLNVVVLFWVLQRATGYVGRSFFVAALFALHPINVESVVWIAERKNSLSMLFFLLALGAYQRYVENPKASRYTAVAIFFALGLMSKPQVITFPFVLLLWDYWPLKRTALRFSRFALGQNAQAVTSGEKRTANGEWRSLLLEKLPLFALSGLSAAITMAAQRADGNKMWYPLSLRVEYALVSYVQYIAKAFWPARLSPFYPHPDFVPLWQAVAAFAFLLSVTLGVVAARRNRPYLMIGWFWFLGTLVPMLGLEGVGYQGKQGIADRYAYLPFIGLFLMASWGIAEFLKPPRLSPVVLRGISVAVLIALGAVTYRQIGHWQDNITLWSHAIAVTEGNFLAENNLGKALLQEKRLEDGAAHFYKAAALYPDDPVSNLNIGIYEQMKGNYSGAIERYQKTLSITRDPELRAAASRYIIAAQQSQRAAAPLQ